MNIRSICKSYDELTTCLVVINVKFDIIIPPETWNTFEKLNSNMIDYEIFYNDSHISKSPVAIYF